MKTKKKAGHKFAMGTGTGVNSPHIRKIGGDMNMKFQTKGPAGGGGESSGNKAGAKAGMSPTKIAQAGTMKKGREGSSGGGSMGTHGGASHVQGTGPVHKAKKSHAKKHPMVKAFGSMKGKYETDG